MRKKIRNIVVFLSVFLSVSAVNVPDTLKVMTFNLRFGELASLSELGSYIKNEQADIVALQECDWKTNRERVPHQAGKAYVNELAYYTELFGLFAKAIDYKGGYYGVGLLSKYPIIKSERVFLPNPLPKTEQRVMLIAEIELPNKSIITVISTHLEVSSAKTRKAQIEFINKRVSQIKTPVILAGDFNATPNDSEIKNGFLTWFNATTTEFTFSTLNPEKKIDYIWCTPIDNFKLITTKVHTDCKLSDHFPVSSLILYNSKK